MSLTAVGVAIGSVNLVFSAYRYYVYVRDRRRDRADRAAGAHQALVE